MPATPKTFDFTEEDLRLAADRAVRQGTGDAVPIFGDDENFPRVWDINDLKDRPQAVWLIENVVEEKGLTVFFGPDKVGKTAVLSNILWAWTSGRERFLSMDMEGEERRVLYVLLEGQANFYSRYDAWCHAYNKGEPVDGFFVMDEGLSLFQSKMEWEDPSTWTPSAKRLWNAVDSLRPNVLVIDTLSRATAGMDENSSSMAHVVGMLDHMRDVYNLSTVIVHHTSLADGDRPRGHSSLKGAASSYVRIEGKPEDPILNLITGPHRNSDVFAKVPFTREHERSSFVIKATEREVPLPLTERAYRVVQKAPNGVLLSDLARTLYPQEEDLRKAKRRAASVVKTHPALTKEGDLVYAVDEEVES